MALKNRDVAIEDRKFFLKRAYESLTIITQSYTIWLGQADFLEVLERNVKQMVEFLYNSRHFTYISVGGDLENMSNELPLTERLFLDHIDTIYLKAQFILRFISHQKVLRHFKTLVDSGDMKLQRYLDQIIETDNNTILRDLNLIQMRIDAFRRFIELF